MAGDIHIAAAVILDGAGRTLVVRKRGTTAFQQAGGKLDAGETSRMALIRELSEEIGLAVDQDRLASLGQFSAPAANEPGYRVIADVFVLRLAHPEDVRPAAEIAEVRWIDPQAPGKIHLAPLTEHEILPRVLAMIGAPSRA